MRIKTSELKGTALDWAVAKCESYPTHISKTGFLIFSDPLIACGPKGTRFNPSTNWMQGGPIIERESIGVRPTSKGWVALPANPHVKPAKGSTPLIAVMRCYVASKLGDEVEMPEELIKFLEIYDEILPRNS